MGILHLLISQLLSITTFIITFTTTFLTSFFTIFITILHLFSRKGDSTYIHKCPFVRSSVRQSVSQSQKPLNSLKSSSSIIHPSTLIIFHSSFLHFATFKLFSLFGFVLHFN